MKTISIDNDNVTILTELHYEISEFVKIFHPVFKKHLIGEMRQRPFCSMEISGIMTIHVTYQITGKQDFKSFYKNIPCQFHRREFPCLVSYQGFIEVSPVAVMPLLPFPGFRMEMSDRTGRYVIDSAPLRVCMNLRIPRHKVFRDPARRGKSSNRPVLRIQTAYGHQPPRRADVCTDQRRHVHAPVRNLTSKVPGDKGYIKKIPVQELPEQGPKLVTTVRKNMKQAASSFNHFILKKRAVIETANDLLKNYFQVEHSGHRSLTGFMNNLITGLIVYTYYPRKPQMRGINIENALVPVK